MLDIPDEDVNAKGARGMNDCVIACQTLRDELLFTMGEAGLEKDVVWIESGLHNTPKKLHARLQETLDMIKGYERVFLVFGTCGNSVLGLKTANFELVMPRVDDCISLLIGSPQKREEIAREDAAYFLTEGWMRGERNLWVEYQYSVKKYGREQADEIARIMYGHYRTLGLLDTSASPVEPLVRSTKVIADTFRLEQKIIPATTAYILELLSGPWPEDRFVVKPPYSELLTTDLILSSALT